MGILSGLQSDPRGTLIILLYQIPAILIALTLHEVSHGYVAYRCGDPTAQMMGRLTLNPLKHLDPIGTLFMVLFGFGWARPVPVNPRNFKHYRRDDLLVSVAGVIMNFCLFFFSTLLLVGINQVMWKQEVWSLGSLTTPREFLSFSGMNFYAVLDGNGGLLVEKANQYLQKVNGDTAYLSLLTPAKFQEMGLAYTAGGDYYFAVSPLSDYLNIPWLIYVQRFLMYFSRINLSLAVFNLLPVPPLDGYHVVNDIFLRGKLHIPARVMNLIMMGMLALFYFTNVFSSFISSVVYGVQLGVLSAVLALFGLG